MPTTRTMSLALTARGLALLSACAGGEATRGASTVTGRAASAERPGG